ncbi:MAG TPA: nuclear transport factor 2 family protein [Solirubrobacteraceae bacterium]|jgi:ketosteroid isomerase-like protein
MSQENVELVLAAYEWASQKQELNLNDVLEEDFEWHTRRDLPDAGVRKGREGAVRLREEWVNAFEDFHVDVDEVTDAGDHVVAVTRLCGCLRGSGQELDLEETQVWTIRDGKAAAVRAYLTRAEAFKAVGLTE